MSLRAEGEADFAFNLGDCFAALAMTFGTIISFILEGMRSSPELPYSLLPTP